MSLVGFTALDANLYRYVGNGPTNETDPSGLKHTIAYTVRLYKYTLPWKTYWYYTVDGTVTPGPGDKPIDFVRIKHSVDYGAGMIYPPPGGGGALGTQGPKNVSNVYGSTSGVVYTFHKTTYLTKKPKKLNTTVTGFINEIIDGELGSFPVAACPAQLVYK